MKPKCLVHLKKGIVIGREVRDRLVLGVMGHVLGNDSVKNVPSLTGKREVGWIFWADDLECRVVRNEMVKRFSICVGDPAVPCGIFGVEVAGYNVREDVYKRQIYMRIENIIIVIS